MKALVKWSVFCTATGRQARYDLDTRRYFDIGDGDLYPKTANHKRLPYRRMAKILKPYKEWLKKRGSRLTFDAFRHLIEDVHRLQFRFIKLDTDRIERIINAHVNVN